jgi:putative NADH-flavin reductase
MKITVFGASGGVGAHVVDLAVQRGHSIRAVYRAAPQVPPPGQAEILVSRDIFDPGFVARAIRGADVVIAALGPEFARRHNPRTTMISPPDLHQRLAHALIAAMKDTGAPARLISVSTGSMGPADAAMSAGQRLLFRFFRTVVTPNLGRVGRDLQAMENELAATALDWYAVRPIKLTDGPLTGHVNARARFTMKTISRADVAWYILNLAVDPRPGHGRTPVLTSAGRGKSPDRPRAAEDVSARSEPARQ